jgi:hypothetical protein
VFKKQINEVIKAAIEDRRIKAYELSKHLGISLNHTYCLLRGKRRWNEDLMDKAFEFLGIEIIFKVKKKKSA